MKIYSNLVKAYRGWRKFENRQFADGFVITQGFYKFKNLQEILNKFIELNNLIKIKNPQDEYIKAKLTASIYCLRSKLGEKINYSEYLQNTIGVTPTCTSELIIKNLSNKIKNKLQQLGIEYPEGHLEKKLAVNKIDNEFIRKLKKQKIELLQKAETYLNITLAEKVYIRLVDEEKYWHYHINIKPNSFELKINTNSERVQHKKGSLEYAIIHELCGHALQLSSWKKQIKTGKISEVCGCIEGYGPEIFMLEGVGESIFYYIFGDKIKDYLEIELMTDELEYLVQNNAYIMINSDNHLCDVVKYYSDRVILKDKKSIQKTLVEVRDDPFLRAYRYVYGASLIFFKNAAKNLDSTQRKKFFRKLYLTPMTYNQINLFYNKINNGE